MARSRNYCFTLFDDSALALEQMLELEGEHAKYVIVGKETCPTNGRFHLQGYVHFHHAKSLQSVKKINPVAHWEVCKGTPDENREYCMKEGDWCERGTPPLSPAAKGEGEKARWTDIIRLARHGDFESVADKYPDVYANQLKKLEYIHKKRKLDIQTLEGDMEHLWIVGKTGSGKSRYAREQNPGAYIKDPQSIWWDDYDHEHVVIIDDFDKFQVKQGGDMKRWLDRYPFQAQIKGGMALIRPTKIIVTSQYHPNEIWDDEKTVDAIMRRVKILDADNVFNKHLFAHGRQLRRAEELPRFTAEMEQSQDPPSPPMIRSETNARWREPRPIIFSPHPVRAVPRVPAPSAAMFDSEM